jgi:hypothetical protein
MVEMEQELEIIEKTVTKTKKPFWYKIIMIFSILSLVVWPLFFLASIIYIFDEIRNRIIAFLAFLAFNSLPFVCVGLLFISSDIYYRKKTLSIIFLLLPIVISCLIWLFMTDSF